MGTPYSNFRPTASEALKTRSRREGATLFVTLLAAFDVLLLRYTGQDDLLLGTQLANRNRGEIEGLIGLFMNTLVMRTELSGNRTFRELMQRVKDRALGAYAHQDLPFEKLVEEFESETRHQSHSDFPGAVFIPKYADAAFGVPGTPGQSDEGGQEHI